MSVKQSTLFGEQTGGVAGNQPVAPWPTPQPRHRKLLRKPEAPFGNPDRGGKYWYQRFHEDLETLPEESRTLVLALVLEWPYERFSAVRALLDKWHRANVMEQDNFREAMGR